MNWLRLHDDFINDPKMRRYFKKEERYAWIALLCLANKGKVRGVISLPDDEISFALEMEDAEWIALAGKFADRRMIERAENGDVVISNWSLRQYEKPSDAPDATRARKQAERDRKKEAEEDNAKRDVTRGHAMSHAIIASHATDTETEAENTPYSPPVSDERTVVPVGTGKENQSDFEEFDATTDPTDSETDTEQDGHGEEHLPTPGEEAAPPAKEKSQRSPRRPSPDAAITALFVGFRRARYPNKSEEWYQQVPPGELKQHRSNLLAIHNGGGTPEQIEQVARNMRRFKWFQSDDQITIPSVTKHWTAALELPDEVPKATAPPPSPMYREFPRPAAPAMRTMP